MGLVRRVVCVLANNPDLRIDERCIFSVRGHAYDTDWGLMSDQQFEDLEREYRKASRKADNKAMKVLKEQFIELGTDQAKAFAITVEADLVGVKGHHKIHAAVRAGAF